MNKYSIGAYIGFGLWGLTLAYLPYGILTKALFWIGEIIIWIGGIGLLAIGSIIWLLICLVVGVGGWISLNDWIMDRKNHE